MKEKRNLSGIYFRYKNPETNVMENRCFEDLPEDKQNDILAKSDIGFIKGLAKMLADTINNISEQLDLMA